MKRIDNFMDSKKAVIIGISITIISIIGLTIVYFAEINTVQQNKNDHYKSAIQETTTYKTTDCNDLVSYLKDNYFLAPDNNHDWYNYLAHVYNKLHELGCKDLPPTNPVIQDWYR